MPQNVVGNLDVSTNFRDGLIEQNGDLTVDVAGCYFATATARGKYAGVTAEGVTDDTTTYFWLDDSGALQKGAAYPVTAHIRLGRVVAAAGLITHIIPERAFLSTAGGGGGGTDPDAIHYNVANEITQAPLKASPIPADILLIEDSEDTWNKKKVLVDTLDDGDVDGPTSSNDNRICVFNGTTGKLIKEPDAGATLGNQDVTGAKLAGHNGLYDNGTSGPTLTIDWNNGAYQKVVLGASPLITFTAPSVSGVYRLTLFLYQDTMGNRNPTWPGSVTWPNGVPPSISTPANSLDILTWIWDGTNYHGNASLRHL